MKRFQLTLAAALLASATSFAAEQFTGSFACKAKYSGKNTYLADSCFVDYTIKRTAGSPSYSAKVKWSKKGGYNVGGVAVNANDVAIYKSISRRYNDVAPTKATFKFTVLFYSDQFNAYIGSAQSSMEVNNLERSGADFIPQVLKIGAWDSLYTNVVIGKQDKAKIGVVLADAAFDKWAGEQNLTKGKLDMTARGSRRSLRRVFANASRVEIVNPTVDLEWDIDEYVFLNNSMKMVEEMSDAIANGDTAGAEAAFYMHNPAVPTVVPTFNNFWRTSVAPYTAVNDAYQAAETAYKKGDFNTAAINYQKVLSLDPSVNYCQHRLNKIAELQKAKESRNIGGIDLVYVEGNKDIKSFYISKTEITYSQWRRVMGAQPGQAYNAEMRNMPMTNITWDEAREFVSKLNEQTDMNYRLVKTNEWEYAANGGKQSSKSEFAGGNNISDVAWTIYNSEETAHPVATKEPNELGIYDMTGNVAEWVANIYDKKTRIAKGGSYADNAANCYINSKQLLDVKYKSKTVGFRIAQDE